MTMESQLDNFTQVYKYTSLLIWMEKGLWTKIFKKMKNNYLLENQLSAIQIN